MGGALTAITEMIKETLGTKTILNYIDAGNYEIFFSEIPHNEGIIVIISSGSTRYLQKSLKQFSKVIAENFLTEIKLDGGIEEDTKKEIDSLLLKTFPYFDLTQEE